MDSRSHDATRVFVGLLVLIPSHAAALHVYSSLLVHFQITFGKFCYEAGFGANKETKKRQSTESLVFGVLFVPPIFLFFPTTFAYFASYLVLHAVALLVRAFLVSFVVYSFDDFDDDDDDFFFDVVYNNNNNNNNSYTLSIKKKKKKRRRRRSIDIINNMITKDFVNALRSFGKRCKILENKLIITIRDVVNNGLLSHAFL